MVNYLKSQATVKASCPYPAPWLNHQCPSVNPSMPGLHHEVCSARGEELMTVPVMSCRWNERDMQSDWVIRVGTELSVCGRPFFAFVSRLLSDPPTGPFCSFTLYALYFFFEQNTKVITSLMLCSVLPWACTQKQLTSAQKVWLLMWMGFFLLALSPAWN